MASAPPERRLGDSFGTIPEVNGPQADRGASAPVRYPILTERLRLRPLEAADVPDLVAYRSRPEVCRWVPFEPMSEADVLERVRTIWSRHELTDEGQGITLGVELPGPPAGPGGASGGRDTIVGDVLLYWTSRAHASGEIGYVLNPDYGGQGFATEAVRAMLEVAFETYRLHRVTARVDARNPGSLALAERLGMRREAHLRENEWFKGGWSDEIDFALLEQEWFGRQR